MSQQNRKAAETIPQSRGIHFEPATLLYALLAAELLLLTSAKISWVPVQRGEPWTVLVCLILAGGTVLVLALWFAIARILCRPFQFSLRSLFLLIVVVAVACGWFANSVQRAKQRTAVIAEAAKMNCGVLYEYNLTDTGETVFFTGLIPGDGWLQRHLGQDFFHEIVGAAPKSDAALQLFKDQTSLRRLILDHTQLTDAGMSALDRLTRLERIDLRDSPAVTDDGLKHFAGLTNLRELLLRRTGVGDAGMAHLKNLKQLRNLDLGMTQVTGAGLIHLAGLIELRQLTFWGNKISDDSLAAIAPMTNLETLDLGGAPVTDAGLEKLSGLVQLRSLGLRGIQVSDAGLRVIRKFENLQTLDLYNSKITDEGLSQLADLHQLETLHVGATAVTDNGVKKLQAHLTNCKIQR